MSSTSLWQSEDPSIREVFFEKKNRKLFDTKPDWQNSEYTRIFVPKKGSSNEREEEEEEARTKSKFEISRSSITWSPSQYTS